MVRPFGRDNEDWPLEETGGGWGNPRRRENSELARLCLDCWLSGLATDGSGGFSRFADDVALRRGPEGSTGVAANHVNLIHANLIKDGYES